MSEKKGPDEVYCRSCGKPIKKKAAICPNCGVANEYDESQHSKPQSQKRTRTPARSNRGGSENEKQRVRNGSTAADSPQHDPSTYSTTVTDRWHYGVAASLLLWIIGFAVPEGSSLAGVFIILAWVLMPLSIFYDRQWLRATTQWNPKSKIWLTLSVIPLINIVAGGVYLFRRYNLEKVSPPGTDSPARHENDSALDELRERYSRGELTDEEFERKVDQVVGTETEETAKIHIKNKKKSEED